MIKLTKEDYKFLSQNACSDFECKKCPIYPIKQKSNPISCIEAYKKIDNKFNYKYICSMAYSKSERLEIRNYFYNKFIDCKEKRENTI